MAFFTSAVGVLQTLVIALGAGLGIWGVINLLEGYGNDNPGAKSQGMKQLMAGGGVALIGEGPRSRTQRMLEDERKSIVRILPNVPVSFIYVGPDAESVPLYKLPTKLRQLKPVLRKPEILAVSNRLNSLGKNGLPIPKGIDPMRVRSQRPR